MVWLNNNLRPVSVIWWLLQGILILINETRTFIKYNCILFPLIAVGFGLVIIALLLWKLKNNRFITLLNMILLIYSIILFVFFILLFIMESNGNYLIGSLIVIPLINISLSIAMLIKIYSKDNM
jgi:hypothetical protein